MAVVEIWQLHVIFMAVFFGLPAGLAYRQYRIWRRKSDTSALERVKKDLDMDF